MDYELTYARPDEFAAVAAARRCELRVPVLGVGAARCRTRHRARHDPRRARRTADRRGERGSTFRHDRSRAARVRVTGLTWVSVEVTHRRRGILRALMEQQVRDCARRGDAAMVLTASEGGIYPRFGYGVATTARKIAIDRTAARIADPISEHGVVRMITEERAPLLPELYDRWRRQTPGGLDRNGRRWQLQLLDRDYQRHGMSELFHLVHADGYLSYRVRTGSNEGRRAQRRRGRRLRAVHAGCACRAVAGAARDGSLRADREQQGSARRPAAVPARRPAPGRDHRPRRRAMGAPAGRVPRCCPRAATPSRSTRGCEYTMRSSATPRTGCTPVRTVPSATAPTVPQRSRSTWPILARSASAAAGSPNSFVPVGSSAMTVGWQAGSTVRSSPTSARSTAPASDRQA